MNFLNIFEDHVAGIFGATRAPFSFKKLAKQAARDMEDQTLVINGVNTAPALYTILIAADDDPMLAPFYPELSREVREFVKAQAEKRKLDTTRWTLARSEAPAIRKLAAALGIQYRELPDGEFSHASVLVLLDREGRIAARTETMGKTIRAPRSPPLGALAWI